MKEKNVRSSLVNTAPTYPLHPSPATHWPILLSKQICSGAFGVDNYHTIFFISHWTRHVWINTRWSFAGQPSIHQGGWLAFLLYIFMWKIEWYLNIKKIIFSLCWCTCQGSNASRWLVAFFSTYLYSQFVWLAAVNCDRWWRTNVLDCLIFQKWTPSVISEKGNSTNWIYFFISLVVFYLHLHFIFKNIYIQTGNYAEYMASFHASTASDWISENQNELLWTA